MKKTILCSSIAMSLLAFQQAEAQTLLVNGEPVSNVDIKSFDYSGGKLNIRTLDEGQMLVVDDGSSGGGNPGDGGDGPGDDGDGPGDDGDGPGDDGDGPGDDGDGDGSCVSNDSIVCGGHLSSNVAEHRRRLTVPAGKTLVSTFTTPSRPADGVINIEGQIGVELTMWISEKPSGSGDDLVTGGYMGVLNQKYCVVGVQTFDPLRTLNWTSKAPGFSCSLDAGKTYYLNIKHGDNKRGSSSIYRTAL